MQRRRFVPVTPVGDYLAATDMFLYRRGDALRWVPGHAVVRWAYPSVRGRCMTRASHASMWAAGTPA